MAVRISFTQVTPWHWVLGELFKTRPGKSATVPGTVIQYPICIKEEYKKPTEEKTKGAEVFDKIQCASTLKSFLNESFSVKSHKIISNRITYSRKTPKVSRLWTTWTTTILQQILSYFGFTLRVYTTMNRVKFLRRKQKLFTLTPNKNQYS